MNVTFNSIIMDYSMYYSVGMKISPPALLSTL